MARQETLLEMGEAGSEAVAGGPAGAARLKEPNRKQMVIAALDVEQLIPAEHLARAIWELVGQLPTAGFLQENKSVEGHAGRPRTCPKMLLAMWVYGYSQAMGEANQIAARISWEPALRWLAGNSVVSARTLSEFRIAHGKALEEVFIGLLGILEKGGFVDLTQVMLDGTKVRAVASGGSMRQAGALQEHLARATVVVEELGKPEGAAALSARQQAARERAARERQATLAAGVAELVEVQASKRRRSEAQVSLTEPEARVMKDGHGGYGPSYNVQVTTESKHQIIVDIEAGKAASDQAELEPAMARVEAALGKLPGRWIVDGGYTQASNIEVALAHQVDLIGPERKHHAAQQARLTARNLQKAGITPEYAPAKFVVLQEGKALQCPAGCELKPWRSTKSYLQYRATKADCGGCAQRAQCCPRSGQRTVKFSREAPEVTAFHERMKKPESKSLYALRCRTEFAHAWIKEKLGLWKFHLRGLEKVNLEVLWVALTYNIQQWFRLDWRAKCAVA